MTTPGLRPSLSAAPVIRSLDGAAGVSLRFAYLVLRHQFESHPPHPLPGVIQPDVSVAAAWPSRTVPSP